MWKKNKKDKKTKTKKKSKFSLTSKFKNQFLTEKSPYKFTSSYIMHNGKVASIFQLMVRAGTNRNLSYNEIMEFIPISTLEGIEIHLITDDVLIKYDDKKRLIAKNSKENKRTLEDSEQYSKQKDEDDNSKKVQRESDVEDYDDYEYMKESAEPVVVFNWRLLIIGNTKEDVEEQKEQLQLTLDQRREGASWWSLPGDQYERFTKLFGKLEKDEKTQTSTGSNYAGLSIVLNPGLFDEKGLPIGQDQLSLTQATACFDFETYTLSQGCICMPRSAYIPYYYDESRSVQISASSIVAQYAANHFVLNGHRVHHIVLNDFDYFDNGPNGQGIFYRPLNIDEFYTRYDVERTTINPMQGFGEDYDKLIGIYTRLIDKIVNIFNLLYDLKLDVMEQSIVKDALNSFYLNIRYWNNNVDKAPKDTFIINVENPEDYTTLGAFINEFESLMTKAMNENRENKADKIEGLQKVLNHALSSYTSVLNRPTNIVSTDADQVFYQFNNIESLTLKQIQFINLIDYIIYTAKKDDVIIIHGFDQVRSEVADMVLPSIQAAKKDGIRFIYAFDNIQSPVVKDGKLNDIFDMQKKYYNDLDSDMSWLFLGTILPSELPLVTKSLNSQLSPTIESQLVNKIPNQVLVHRRAGEVNNFVRVNVLI